MSTHVMRTLVTHRPELLGAGLALKGCRVVMVAGLADTGVQKGIFFKMETQGSTVEDTGLAARDKEGLLVVYDAADSACCEEGFPDGGLFGNVFEGDCCYVCQGIYGYCVNHFLFIV